MSQLINWKDAFFAKQLLDVLNRAKSQSRVKHQLWEMSCLLHLVLSSGGDVTANSSL